MERGKRQEGLRKERKNTKKEMRGKKERKQKKRSDEAKMRKIGMKEMKGRKKREGVSGGKGKEVNAAQWPSKALQLLFVCIVNTLKWF